MSLNASFQMRTVCIVATGSSDMKNNIVKIIKPKNLSISLYQKSENPRAAAKPRRARYTNGCNARRTPFPRGSGSPSTVFIGSQLSPKVMILLSLTKEHASMNIETTHQAPSPVMNHVRNKLLLPVSTCKAKKYNPFQTRKSPRRTSPRYTLIFHSLSGNCNHASRANTTEFIADVYKNTTKPIAIVAAAMRPEFTLNCSICVSPVYSALPCREPITTSKRMTRPKLLMNKTPALLNKPILFR
mmetsp:Transcript_8625/g.34141  ORF Transcript_8625/g.34141 Transcript_8625/m.34141 type:complete len:243 (+) Transcript_8625:121-849(+)